MVIVTDEISAVIRLIACHRRNIRLYYDRNVVAEIRHNQVLPERSRKSFGTEFFVFVTGIPPKKSLWNT